MSHCVNPRQILVLEWTQTSVNEVNTLSASARYNLLYNLLYNLRTSRTTGEYFPLKDWP